MTEAEQWAEDLLRYADRLSSPVNEKLSLSAELHEELCRLIHRFQVKEDLSQGLSNQVQYPPDWDNLGAAVQTPDPHVLLDNMWGWVSTGRWVDEPLTDIHGHGWLVPALRRLAQHAPDLQLEPGVDY